MLKAKIGDKEASAFVTILETRVDKKFEEAKSVLATKEDLARDIGNAKVHLIKWSVGLWIAQMAAIIGLYLRH